MKWLLALIIVGVIGYVVYVNQSTPKSPEEQRAEALKSATGVAKYFCMSAIRGSTADMDSVSTDKARGDGDSVIRALRAEETALKTQAVEANVIVGGGAGSAIRDAKAIFKDANDDLIFSISVIRTEKQDNGEWRITHVSIN